MFIYSAYKYLNSEGHLVFETDFESILYVKPELMPVISRDLAELSLQESMPGSSELMLNVNNVEYRLKRSAAGEVWESEVAGPAAPDLEGQIPFVVRPAQDILLELHQLTTSGVELDQGQLKARLKEIVGEDAEAYLSNITQLNSVQAQLDLQKEVDNAHTRIKETEAAIAQVDSKLEAVSTLAKRESEIAATLARYVGANLEQIDQQGEQYKAEVKNARITKILNERKVEAVQLRPVQVEIKKPKIMPDTKKILILAGVLVVAGIVGVAVSGSIAALVIAVGLGLLELFLFAVINLLPAQVVAVVGEDGTAADAAVPSILADENMSKLEKFFVDKAWMDALQQEAANVKQSISVQLEGQDYEDIKTSRRELEAELARLQELITAHQGKDIPPEEYLKKRREVDLLKIERSRLEGEFREHESKNEIFKIIDSLEDSEEEEQDEEGNLAVYASQLNPHYSDLRFHDGKLEVIMQGGSEWQQHEFAPEELYGLFLLTNLDKWLKTHDVPIILVDVLTKLSGQARNAVDAKITHARSLGQVIVINPLA